jgi:signal transduction histidine kinase
MKFFSRLFLYVSGALLVGVSAAVVLLDQHYVQALQQEEYARTQGIQQLVQQQIIDHSDRQQRLIQWQDKFGYRLSLLPLADLPLSQAKKQQLLQQGSYVRARSGWVVDDVTVFYFFPQCHCVLVAEKMYYNALAHQHYGNGLVLMVFLVLGLFVFLYVRNNQGYVWRLSEVYQAYGSGDFRQRVDERMPHPYDELAQRFNDMAERIETLMNEHQLMVNGVSHDLKNPLARLRFALDMTRECHSVADYQRQVQQMDQCLDDLTELLDDWLLLAKLNGQAYPVTLNRCALAPMIEQVSERLSPLTPSVQLTLKLDGSEAFVDASLFSRILENLISNGFKFAHSQLRIALQANNQGFVLTVEDDGPGVPDADKTRILQPFVRLDDSRSSQGGGLGLAIVVNLLEKHGFDLQVLDSELGGAMFLIKG